MEKRGVQEWEYQSLELGWALKQQVPKVRYVNGEELPNWDNGPYYLEFLLRMGEEGWEKAEQESVHIVMRRRRPAPQLAEVYPIGERPESRRRVS